MKRTVEGRSVNMTLREQLRALKGATLTIEQSDLHEAICSIAHGRDKIVEGANADDGCAVVDSIEQYLNFYHVIACEESLLSEIIQTLNISDKCPKVLPSFTALCECLDQLLIVASDKDKLEEVISTTFGSVVNDYLQGRSLTMIEDVANACAEFAVIVGHLDEMTMLVDE
jgi:hypothetical protein